MHLDNFSALDIALSHKRVKLGDGLLHHVSSIVVRLSNSMDARLWIEKLMNLMKLFLCLKLHSIEILDNVLVLYAH